MPKLKHYDNLGTIRFITFSCHNRMNLFIDDKIRTIFLKHLDLIRQKYGFKLHAFVIMPNHVHLVIFPEGNTPIGKMIGELKSNSSREILDHLRDIKHSFLKYLKVMRRGEERLVFWQKRCYDHNCRGLESVKEKIRYCHRNPVTSGLVGMPEDWEWSSFNNYYQDSNCGIEIDKLDSDFPTASGGAPQIKMFV